MQMTQLFKTSIVSFQLVQFEDKLAQLMFRKAFIAFVIAKPITTWTYPTCPAPVSIRVACKVGELLSVELLELQLCVSFCTPILAPSRVLRYYMPYEGKMTIHVRLECYPRGLCQSHHVFLIVSAQNMGIRRSVISTRFET